MHSSSWQNLVKSHPKWKLLKITNSLYVASVYFSPLYLYCSLHIYTLIFSQNSTESLSLWVFWGVQVLHYPFPVKATQIYNKISIHLINHHLRTFHKPRCHNFEKAWSTPISRFGSYHTLSGAKWIQPSQLHEVQSLCVTTVRPRQEEEWGQRKWKSFSVFQSGNCFSDWTHVKFTAAEALVCQKTLFFLKEATSNVKLCNIHQSTGSSKSRFSLCMLNIL